MEIPEDSANFWRKMFQEPKGIVDFIPPCPTRIHLNRRIRMDGIRDNGKWNQRGYPPHEKRYLPGHRQNDQKKIQGLGAKILKKWYNRWLDEGIIPKPLKRLKLIPKHEGAKLAKDFRPFSFLEEISMCKSVHFEHYIVCQSSGCNNTSSGINNARRREKNWNSSNQSLADMAHIYCISTLESIWKQATQGCAV